MNMFTQRIEALAADALAERAAKAGRSVEQEISFAREHSKPLTVAEKLALSARMRAMTPTDCLSDDSTAIIRWFRDTNCGRDTDDGWNDDDRR